MHTYVSINKVACHPLPTREYADVLYARTCYGTREPVTGGEGVAATPIIGPRVNQTPVGSCFVHGPQLVYPCADDSVVAVRRWAGVDNKATVGFFCCPQSSFPFKDSSRRDCAHQHIVGSSGWSINVFIIDSIYIYIYTKTAQPREDCAAETTRVLRSSQMPSKECKTRAMSSSISMSHGRTLVRAQRMVVSAPTQRGHQGRQTVLLQSVLEVGTAAPTLVWDLGVCSPCTCMLLAEG